MSVGAEYLLPQWHGSDEELHRFALECVNSKKWGGNVPLIMLDYHDHMKGRGTSRKAYYSRPEVWAEIHGAFEKFYQLVPDADGWHHNYFWFAYQGGDWATARQQMNLMGGEVNYDYFGGEDQFKMMVADVRERAAAPKSR